MKYGTIQTHGPPTHTYTYTYNYTYTYRYTHSLKREKRTCAQLEKEYFGRFESDTVRLVSRLPALMESPKDDSNRTTLK